jgi:hypothetical protein
MACFIVPGTEAIVASVVKKIVDKKEAKRKAAGLPTEAECAESEGRLSWHTKLSWLENMLWGGAALLALEHIWHGEVVFYPPFLSAMSSPADTAAMLHEMATVGVSMAVAVTAVWAVGVFAIDHIPALRRKVEAVAA